ncbi:sam/hd domain protein, putative [Entamoeba dispar SAW760]|uniref:Sam/hd domain protein, putative n=1 Tax=Entamoeba dispar (strain ATCC PRA-260 / SAW760) TaxID=370354 RepID=B0EAX0_ENTDS|nr:sam/hd domain protein, putative [Entamoeba dispar SAW760]EDR28338.1 sam/hd domain protein, putative [Entamoeba dispar SAW760]|eukprot:EDR28338.1 sam/hd domain protein, putative [Entamoeba dispar SAW760]
MSQTTISTPKKRSPCEMVKPNIIKRRQSNIKTENFYNEKLSCDSETITKTIEFQRLRRIKQLGTAHYIFPSGTHTRYEHSLGVAQLANKMVRELNIKQCQKEEVDKNDYVTGQDAKLIEIAGLCHDLGHGPFSHLYERLMKTRNIHFNHEEQSAKIFHRIVDQNQIDLTEEEIKIVKSLITNEGDCDKSWRRQIISNEENGIDVDRLDYLRRDSHHLNLPLHFKVQEIIQNCAILNNNICYFKEVKSDIVSFFTNRYSLYSDVYLNNDTTSVELMFTDLLAESYNYIPLLQTDPNDLDKFIQLDDGIVDQIRFTEKPELQKAKAILHRVERGDFYQIVSTITQTEENEHLLNDLTSEQICCAGSNLRPEDIIVDNQSIVLAREYNWNKIPFIESNDSKEFFYLTPSILYPTENKTQFKRVYARDRNKVNEIKKAVNAFFNHNQFHPSIVME